MVQLLNVAPSQEAWDSMREHILDEYFLPEMTLGQVMTKMADTYRFHATKAMYKGKLRKWGVRKSLDKNRRSQLVQLALKKYKSGQVLPEKDSNGKIIPWDRVRRDCRSKNIHKDMWDTLELPERPPVLVQLDHLLRRSRLWIVSEDFDPSSTIVMTLYQPRSPTHHVSVMISQIRDFQSWRSVRLLDVPGYFGAEDSQERFFDTAREDAALNVVNECLIAFRHLQFGFKDRAIQYFDSAAQNFDRYLDRPSMFVLYAILMLYWNVCPDDPECLSFRDAIFQRFRNSCEQNIGPHSPLTKVVQQMTSSTDNVERIWSIALYSWILNTKGQCSTRAAKYTAANIKLGLALALQSQGCNASAISVYKEFLADGEKDTNPLHGKSRPTRCRIANLYRLERRYEEAEATLDALLADVEDEDTDLEEGIIYCHSLRGQIFEETQRHEQASEAYRRAVACARKYESREGPLTIMYGRMYYDFLRSHAFEFERALFETEYLDVMDAIEDRSTCSHTGKNQLLLLNTFADVGIHDACSMEDAMNE